MFECDLTEAFNGLTGKDWKVLGHGSELGVPDLSRLEHCRQEGTRSFLGDSWRFLDCPIAGPHLGPSQ